MMQYKKILCPIDFSESSTSAIELASTTAKQHNAALTFVFVSDLWTPDEALADQEFILQEINEQKKALHGTHPVDCSIAYSHIFLQGNPGPKIVELAKDFDLIIMSTHGRNALVRILVGSVAEYTMRHATCPVVIMSLPDPKKSAQRLDTARRFVTGAMHHTQSIRDYEEIETVIPGLVESGESAAPVVDGLGKCIGILTSTDIEKFADLKRRFESRDETVLTEMFESNRYGQLHVSNHDFYQVKRHMTAPVITISNTAPHQEAVDLFASNPNIHHLVVIDNCERPVGVIVAKDLIPADAPASSP